MERRWQVVRALVGARLGLLVALLLLLSSAFASGPSASELPACMPPGVADTLGATADWRAVVDREVGLAVLLPLSHQLSASGDSWYAFETLDGVPLVPDVTIALHRGLSVEEVAGEWFGEAATLEPVRLGPATTGYRATVLGRAGAEGYLVASEQGTYSIIRYEDFDWDGFDAVACSFHLVELVGHSD